MSPEYAMRGVFSVKSDVYSFGVLMLEIVSGVKISCTDQIMEFGNLIVYVSIKLSEFPMSRIKVLESHNSDYLFDSCRHGTSGRKGRQKTWWIQVLWRTAYQMKPCFAST
jgi:hypothetical protein